jgi:hypothetical protein
MNVQLRARRAGACLPPSCGRRRRRGTSPRPTICSAGGTGFETWKKFDKELARELSMPVVVDALEVFKAVLEERGEWEG